jgi:hypothetical protein
MASDGKFKWWAGDDEERFTVGPCDTRDECLAEAKVNFEQPFTLHEADKMLPSCMGADGLAQRALEDMAECECWSEDGMDDAWTDAQVRELEEALAATVNAWVKKNPPDTFTFGVCRNVETWGIVEGQDLDNLTMDQVEWMRIDG